MSQVAETRKRGGKAAIIAVGAGGAIGIGLITAYLAKSKSYTGGGTGISSQVDKSSGLTSDTFNFTETVKDASGNPVPNASVYIFQSGSSSPLDSGFKTDSTGKVVIPVQFQAAGTYILIASTSANNSDPSARSNAVSVTVTQAPFTVKIQSNTTSGKAPLTVGLSVNATGGTPSSYSWTDSTGAVLSTASSYNPVFSNPGTYVISLKCTTSDGRTSSDSVTISVIPASFTGSISLSATSGPAPLSVTATANPSGGNAPYTYAWYVAFLDQPGVNNQFIGSGSSAKYTFTQGKQHFMFLVEITDSKGFTIGLMSQVIVTS